jgi:hypothetical protein
MDNVECPSFRCIGWSVSADPHSAPRPVRPDAPPRIRVGSQTRSSTARTSSRCGASRFYWGWLVFATSVSVLGNITHALLVAPDAQRLLAAVASVVPPAFVLGSTHSVGLSLRMRRFAPAYVLGLLMTIGVAACAFFLSFDALRALAVILGWPRVEQGFFRSRSMFRLPRRRSVCCRRRPFGRHRRLSSQPLPKLKRPGA